MNDETKAANEALVESMLRQLRGCVSVGDEMTLDHACLIDDAADWIAGEPARLAAKAEEPPEERARVVAWLRERAIEESSSAPNYIDDLADAIERGEHEEGA